MTVQLDGKTALVTGGSSGIGREIARHFVTHGARVHIIGRDARRLEEARVSAMTPSMMEPHQVDLADGPSLESFITAFRSSHEHLDILVNNAGIFDFAPLAEVTPEAYDRMMDVNLRSVLRLTQGMLPLLRAAGHAAIVNIASTLAYMPVPRCGVYSISKAGLIMLTRSLAMEHAAEGIRCNVISPGVVDTPVFQTLMSPDQAAAHL
ncbi:MAG: SDR family oxidoreductase, partial [Acidobacteria bacterium]|nr:SDR family oxidoreductase [Acidobacteriota bacterium]